jgi:hypothetical protein
MWRFLQIFVVAFWLVMTAWLVRSVYFPEDAGFAEVPPKLILKTFLEQGGLINTLHVFHRDRKIGNAAVTPRRSGEGADADYDLLISGLLDKDAIEDVDGPISWHMELHLLHGDAWGGAVGRVRLLSSNTSLDFNWAKDKSIPAFTLKKNGLVVADDTLVQPLIAQMTMGQEPALPGGVDPEGVASTFNVKSREGLIKLAGQKRKGYVIEVGFMDRYNLKAFFTEAGELALVELPEGYRLLEPVIYGLIPDQPEEEVTK